MISFGVVWRVDRASEIAAWRFVVVSMGCSYCKILVYKEVGVRWVYAVSLGCGGRRVRGGLRARWGGWRGWIRFIRY